MDQLSSRFLWNLQPSSLAILSTTKALNSKMPPKLTQNPPDPDLITTITEFQISPDINILELNLDDGSLLSAKWAKVMNPLRNTPGWKYAQWGRLIERPDTVLLVSGTVPLQHPYSH